MRELPRVKNETMDDLRDVTTDEVGNEQVHISEEDARKIKEQQDKAKAEKK